METTRTLGLYLVDLMVRGLSSWNYPRATPSLVGGDVDPNISALMHDFTRSKWL